MPGNIARHVTGHGHCGALKIRRETRFAPPRALRTNAKVQELLGKVRLEGVRLAGGECVALDGLFLADTPVVPPPLVEIAVQGWDVREPLSIACNGDRVMSRVRTTIVEALAQKLRH